MIYKTMHWLSLFYKVFFELHLNSLANTKTFFIHFEGDVLFSILVQVEWVRCPWPLQAEHTGIISLSSFSKPIKETPIPLHYLTAQREISKSLVPKLGIINM